MAFKMKGMSFGNSPMKKKLPIDKSKDFDIDRMIEEREESNKKKSEERKGSEAIVIPKNYKSPKASVIEKQKKMVKEGQCFIDENGKKICYNPLFDPTNVTKK
jgi:hypothetical protein